MEIVLHQLLPKTAAHNVPAFPPLDEITRPSVPTDHAAYYLNRKQQTLRAWACHEDGPIRPFRINGRLAWRICDIRSLLEGALI